MTRILLTGWFSFLHGEATAGDVLALDSVRRLLDQAGLDYDVAWSPVFRPGGLRLEDATAADYTDLVFVCGPVHGDQVAGLHRRFSSLRRIAVGVTVIDRADPAWQASTWCWPVTVIRVPRSATCRPPSPGRRRRRSR